MIFSTERAKLEKQREEWHAEYKSLAAQIEQLPRIKKNEIEELRRQATRLAKERDDANRNPRRGEIQTEVRIEEDHVHSVKRQIEDDRMVLEQLRHCAEAQNAIVVLKDQCRNDVENLSESITDKAQLLQQYDLNVELPVEDENQNDGSALQDYVENKHDRVRELHTAKKQELETANTALSRTQKAFSEKSAVLGSKQQRHAAIDAKLTRLNAQGGSVTRAKVIVNTIYDHEVGIHENPPAKDSSPSVLIEYLDTRLKVIEEDAPGNTEDAKVAKKVLKQIAKRVRVYDDTGKNVTSFTCPCCARALDSDDEVKTFDNTMKALIHGDIIAFDEAEFNKFKALQKQYKGWRASIGKLADDLRDFRRMSEEAKALEQEIQDARKECQTIQTTLTQQKKQTAKLQAEVDDLRNLQDTTKRWADDASRIKEKRMQIGQKNIDLSVSQAGAGRDLRTVEKEMADRMEQKDSHMNNINRLNKEMTQLNNMVASLSTQVSARPQGMLIATYPSAGAMPMGHTSNFCPLAAGFPNGEKCTGQRSQVRQGGKGERAQKCSDGAAAANERRGFEGKVSCLHSVIVRLRPIIDISLWSLLNSSCSSQSSWRLCLVKSMPKRARRTVRDRSRTLK